MRIATLALCLALVLTGVGRAADTVSASDQDAIERVITAQIDAFRHDDGKTAFGYASPHIKSLFGGPATFLAMVKQGYAPVTNPSSVHFGALEEHDGQPTQAVELGGPDGQGTLALYTMEHEADGTWRIGGCVLVRSPQTQA